MVAGCGRVDSGDTYFPEIIRNRAPKPALPYPAPDVRALLQSDLSAVFHAASTPTNVSFSVPKPACAEWTTCVRASVSGTTAVRSECRRTFVNIDHGKVSRRERVDGGHSCMTEHHELL